VIVIIFGMISPQMKTRAEIIFFALLVDVFFTLQFVILGKWTGVVTGAVNEYLQVISAAVAWWKFREKKQPV